MLTSALWKAGFVKWYNTEFNDILLSLSVTPQNAYVSQNFMVHTDLQYNTIDARLLFFDNCGKLNKNDFMIILKAIKSWQIHRIALIV
jgi:hypothetical protein